MKLKFSQPAKEDENTASCLDEEAKKTCELFVQILEYSTALPFRIINNKYKCFYCRRSFKLPTKLKEHTLQNHVYEDLKSIVYDNLKKAILKLDISYLQCKICLDQFEDTNAFVTHLQSHEVRVEEDLKTQILSFKLSDEGISCYTCKKEFRYLASLFGHAQKALKGGTFSCESCSLTFCSRNSLARHINQEHMTTNFDCDVCGKKFNSNYSKNHHKRRVHDLERRKCPVCNKILSSAYQKSTHLAKAHNIWTSKFKCDTCQRIFLKNNQLSIHIRREHLKEKNVTCEVCGQRFFDNHLLENHRIKHENTRAFECYYCSKRFTRKKAKDVHERIHTNDRRCVCKECGRAFVQYASLHWHQKMYHGQKAVEKMVMSTEEPTPDKGDE